MIHAIHLPQATADALNKLVDILVVCCKVMRKMAQTGPLDHAAIAQFYAAVAPTKKDDLAKWFLKRKLPDQINQEVVDWLDKAIPDMETLKTPSNTTAPQLAGDISSIVKAQNERKRAAEDTGLPFPASEGWALDISDFFLTLYEGMRSGDKLPAVLKQVIGPFDGQALLHNFQDDPQNPKICPVCDMELAYQVWPGKTVGISYRAHLDHYFPKSHYPHLALHPHNLVPICRSCNEGRGDSLYALGSHWRDVWVPYQDAALNRSHYFEEPALIRSLPGTAPVKARALSSLESDYKIPARWDRVSEQAEQEVFARLKAYVQANGLEDLAALDSVLKSLLRDTIDAEFGVLPFAFLRAGILRRMLLTEVRGTGNPLPKGSTPLLNNLRPAQAQAPKPLTEELIARYLE